jgi:DNA-binding NarL/FixJ family response regulator
MKSYGTALALTRRQTEVWKAIAKGKTTKAIAKESHTSVRTIETHRALLFVKIGANNMAHATYLAYQQGIVTVEKPKPAPVLNHLETQVVELTAQGKSSREIAAHIRRSVRTVEHGRLFAHRKLNTHQIAALVSVAIECGIIKVTPDTPPV